MLVLFQRRNAWCPWDLHGSGHYARGAVSFVMLRRLLISMFLSAAAFSFAFSYGVVEDGTAVQTIRDQAGRETTIPSEPMRVISAHGPTTSFLYVTGVEDRLVAAGYLGARDPRGRLAMEEIDPRFPAIMRDGVFSQRSFNVEEALRLEADLVVSNARSSWIESAERAGIPVVLFAAESVPQIIAAMELTGEIFGPSARARVDAWVDLYQTVIAEIAAKNAGDNELPAVLFTGPDPLQVASGAMYQSAMIDIAGGRNVAVDLPGFWTEVGLEQIARWDPDVILIPAYGAMAPEELAVQPGWSALRAVEEGRVYRMPKLVAPWDTPTPDSLLGIIWLAALLDPSSDGAACRDAVTDYYREFYTLEVRDLDYFCGALDDT